MFPWLNWRSLRCHPACVSIAVNRQVKVKILARGVNVCFEHIKHPENQTAPGTCEGKWSEKEGSQRESTLVQLKGQTAPLREAHYVRTNGKELELLEPITYEFMA